MKSWLALFIGTGFAQVNPQFFAAKVYPVLESAQCRICHSRAGVASGTRLHFPEKDASEKQIQSFGLSLAPLNSLLLAKPLNLVKHTGGERIAPGSDGAKLLADWVNYLAVVGQAFSLPAERELKPKPSQSVRRLTHSQYNNTIRDLLGDPSRPAQRFPPEDFVDGFKNQLRNQGMSPLLVESYSAAAEKVAQNAFRSGEGKGIVAGCPGPF